MKAASAQMQTHIAQNSTTIATCWKLKRKDGTILGFTDHDEDIAFDLSDGDGLITYKAATGYTRTAIANTSDLSVDNLEVKSFLDSSAIKDADLRAGLFDLADLRIFMVNWVDLTQGKIDIRSGILGEVTTQDDIYIAEMMGLAQRLTQQVGRTYTPTCTVDLGSPECGIVLKPDVWQASTVYAVGNRVRASTFDARKYIVTVAGTSGGSEPSWNLTVGGSTTDNTVTWETEEAWTLEDDVASVTDNATIVVTGITEVANKVDGWFDLGLVTWLSGNNIGLSKEIKTWVKSTKTLELFEAMPFVIQAGDQFEMYPGCDKTLLGTNGCKVKFNNVINFQGFPHVPGNDAVLQFPDART